jgi:hypothetical protein
MSVTMTCPRCQGVMQKARALAASDPIGFRLSEVYLIVGNRKLVLMVYLCMNCWNVQIFTGQEKPEPEPQQPQRQTGSYRYPRIKIRSVAFRTARQEKRGPNWKPMERLIFGDKKK